jgi:hypothetical protein
MLLKIFRKTRTSSWRWNRPALVRAIAEGLAPLPATAMKNRLVVKGKDFTYEASFFVQTYKEANELWLGTESASLLPQGVDTIPEDYLLRPALCLEDLRKLFHCYRYKCLFIHSGDKFTTSRLGRDVHHIYRPLLQALTSYDTCFDFLSGQKIKVGISMVNFSKLEPIERAWCLVNAFNLATHFKDAKRQQVAVAAIEKGLKNYDLKLHLLRMLVNNKAYERHKA